MAKHSIYDLHDAIKIDENADKLDLFDAIHARLSQAKAQIFAISFGEGLDHFESFSLEYKGCYLWALDRTIAEIDALFSRYHDILNSRN